MSKIYARQIPPEYQESPLFLDDASFHNINVRGNRNYTAHTSELFDRVHNALAYYSGGLLEAWDDLTGGNSPYYTWADALADIVPEEGRDPYTREERKHTWPNLAHAYNFAKNGREENDLLCQALALVTGKPWEWRTLRGCCQGDWNEAFYCVEDWDRETLCAFEIEYFNTGTEWIIHDEENEPEDPDDISGFSVYCLGWNEDQIKREIAEYAGGSPENVTLYKFNGWTRTAIYEEV